MANFDVLVVGGGSAGIAAGISAARSGARTLLIERGGALGGMASAALVHSICGLYELPPPNAGLEPVLPVLANRGFAAEFASALNQGRSLVPVRMGKVFVLMHHPTGFALTADRLVQAEPNLKVLFHCELVSIKPDFKQAALLCRGQTETFSVGSVVDATGDAVAVAMGEAAWEQEASERLQRPAFIFSLQGVEPASLADDGRLRIAARIAGAVAAGSLPAGVLGSSFRPTGRGGETFVTIDLDVAGYDPLAAGCLTALEIQGRELAQQLARFLHEEVPGFEASFLAAFPTRIGVRESRRLIGRQRLETIDLEQGSRFDDGIARATWPMELRETNRGAKLRYPMDGRPCDIPLGALRARDQANLFAAGRCIASSHEAQASIRVIGTCLATGEAAGIAASLFARDGECAAEAVRAVQQKLCRRGDA